MNLHIITIIAITFFGIFLVLILYYVLLCMKKIARLEGMLRKLYPSVGEERIYLAENLKHSLETIKEINRLLTLKSNQDNREKNRVIN